MHVDDDGVGRLAQRTGGKLRLHAGEGIVERIHEDAAHDVDHEHALALSRLVEIGAAARACRAG